MLGRRKRNYVALVPAVIASLPLLRVYVAGLPFISLWRWLRSHCFYCFVFFFFLFFILFIVILSMSYSLLCTYSVPVMWTFDKTSDLGSSWTVPRTFIQDTVTCWLVATTACSCGFRTIDIVWLGPVFLVPGFLRRPNPCGFGGCPPRPGLVQSCVLVPDVFS